MINDPKYLIILVMDSSDRKQTLIKKILNVEELLRKLEDISESKENERNSKTSRRN